MWNCVNWTLSLVVKYCASNCMKIFKLSLDLIRCLLLTDEVPLVFSSHLYCDISLQFSFFLILFVAWCLNLIGSIVFYLECVWLVSLYFHYLFVYIIYFWLSSWGKYFNVFLLFFVCEFLFSVPFSPLAVLKAGSVLSELAPFKKHINCDVQCFSVLLFC